MDNDRDDVFVYYIEPQYLPSGTHEFVTPCLDGYSVYIDVSQDDAHRLASYQHALQHIVSGDFDTDAVRTVQEIEADAHGLTPSAPPSPEIDIWANAKKLKGIPDDIDAWKEAQLKRLRSERKKIQRKLKEVRQRVKALEEIGHNFSTAAERRWLDPE